MQDRLYTFLWKLSVDSCHCVLFLWKLSVNSYSSGTLPGTPETLPVSNRSEDAHNETQSSSKKNVQLLPVKKEDTALLGASPGVRRRSKRLKAS